MTGHLKHFPQRNHAGRQSREQKGMIDRIKSQWNQNNKFPTMNGDSNIIVDPDQSCLIKCYGWHDRQIETLHRSHYCQCNQQVAEPLLYQ